MRALVPGSIGIVLWLGTPAVAWSDPLPDTPSPVLARNAEAVSAGRFALEAYQRGEWAAAYQRFQHAESIAHSPVFVLYMARSKERLGALLEALDLYARVASEPESSAAPAAWRLAAEAARAERRALARRVPSLIVRLARGSTTNTTVTLDGVRLERVGEEVLVDPGAHEVVARRFDGVETRARITASEGQKRVPLELGFPRARLAVPAPRPPIVNPGREDGGHGVYAVLAFSSAVALLSASGYFAWRAESASDRVSRAFARNEAWSGGLAASERDGERSQAIAAAALSGGLLAAGLGTWIIVFD